MRNLHDPLRLLASKRIHSALARHPFFVGEPQTLPELSTIYDQLVEPPQSELGDLAFGCFFLARATRLPPPKIAEWLATELSATKASGTGDFLTEAKPAGPYLNLSFSPETIGKELLVSILNGEHFSKKLTAQTPKTMIEYSQPNTHKELHVGHMRNACLGNALVKTLRYAGYDVIASTFPGDVGTHVAKCLWYLKFHNKEPMPTQKRGEWLGQLYSKAHLKLEDEEKTDKYEVNKAQLTEILKQLEAKSGEYYDQWKETREWSIGLMMELYDWAHISFDEWYWESQVDSASVEWIKKLRAEGKLIESQGAVGLDLSEDNLGFCMLLKSDGTGLYATKDMELARRKFQDFKIEKSIYVVDMRQALHFKQVFKTLEKLGFEQAKNCLHLQYNFVELPDGAMSSRKGNIVPVMKLVERMQEQIKTQYLSRYASEWSAEEINLVAHQVAEGAIKYGMVKIDNNKKIVFDMEEWLKLDGDSGPFIQYSGARIQSLCRKFNWSSDKASSVNWNLLVHPTERKLYQSLMHFNTTAVMAADTFRPSIICTYLMEVAKSFNHFYHECSIGEAPSEELKTARLALSSAAGSVLKKGLEVLGIPMPERM